MIEVKSPDHMLMKFDSRYARKEQVRICDRNAFFEEGVKLDEEARQRRSRLEEVKRKKLEELRYVELFEINKVGYNFFIGRKNYIVRCHANGGASILKFNIRK